MSENQFRLMAERLVKYNEANCVVRKGVLNQKVDLRKTRTPHILPMMQTYPKLRAQK